MQERNCIAQYLINSLKTDELQLFSGVNTLEIRKRIRKYPG
jgi:hypothetical protein